jgi:hypothetical protein
VFGFFQAVQAPAHRDGVKAGKRYPVVAFQPVRDDDPRGGWLPAKFAHRLDLEMFNL